MAETLGPFLVEVLLVFLGIFLMIAAYSRKPLLLKIAAFGMIHIDPDSPGYRQRTVMFTLGAILTALGAVMLLVDKLATLRAVPS